MKNKEFKEDLNFEFNNLHRLVDEMKEPLNKISETPNFIEIRRIIEKFIKYFAKIFGIFLEPPFEIVDNLDLFVKDKLNLMLEGAKNLDIATGYFKISGWQVLAESIENFLNTGGRIRLLIGDASRENLLPQTAKFLLRLIKNPQIEARTIKPRILHAIVFMAKTKKKIKTSF